MSWVVLGLLVHILIGYSLLNWAAGRDFTVSRLSEIVLPVVLWPFYLRGLIGLRIMRMMMLDQMRAIEAWAKEEKADS